MCARRELRRAIAMLLLGETANVHAASGVEGQTPLHVAAKHGRLGAATLLVARGAGRSAVHRAAVAALAPHAALPSPLASGAPPATTSASAFLTRFSLSSQPFSSLSCWRMRATPSSLLASLASRTAVRSSVSLGAAISVRLRNDCTQTWTSPAPL